MNIDRVATPPEIRRETRLAIRNGVIPIKPCEVCGFEPAHVHHESPDDPLNIRFLCPNHHYLAHNPNPKPKKINKRPQHLKIARIPKFTPLSAYLEKMGIDRKAFAEQSDIPLPTVYRLCDEPERIPDGTTIAKIVKATNGAVGLFDLVGEPNGKDSAA